MLWECLSCGCIYAVGLTKCPHCLGITYKIAGEQNMPKITVHGGPSNADAEREEELKALYKDPIVEEEESLAGINSLTLPSKQVNTQPKKRRSRQVRVQTTENL
jgi:hypothetical protein